MPEYIDIFDANMTPIGTMERVQAHMEGQWHSTYHLWIVSRDHGGFVLYQMRSPQMVNFPNCLDVSAAGHLEAGETVQQGIREVEEELGIKIPEANIRSLGFRVEVADQKNGQRNREYQAIFMSNVELPFAEYRPQEEEVSGLFAVPISKGMELFSGEIENITVNGIINRENRWEATSRVISRSDFLPRIQNYYLTIHIMAQRLLSGEKYLSIS